MVVVAVAKLDFGITREFIDLVELEARLKVPEFKLTRLVDHFIEIIIRLVIKIILLPFLFPPIFIPPFIWLGT